MMHSKEKLDKVGIMSVELDYTGPKKANSGNQNTAALFVSLYVVILAFFILLTANAQYDVEKSRSVMDSVNKAFAKRIKVDTSFTVESVGSEITATRLFNDVQQAITSVIPMEELNVITDGKRMLITMPVSALFDKESADLRPSRAGFYRRLSEALAKWYDHGASMELAFTQGVRKTKPATALNLEIARGGNFARMLENRGVAPEDLTIGIGQGKPEELRFEFTLQSFAPQKDSITIEQPAETPDV